MLKELLLIMPQEIITILQAKQFVLIDLIQMKLQAK